MALPAVLPAALLFALLLSSAAAHNITNILSQFPDFSAFNDMLNQTGLAAEINRRQTITVLAVSNSELDAISGRPLDIVKRILSVHVVLDYYGPIKLGRLSKKTAVLTTLFQTTGQAVARSGFLNVTDLPDGRIAFGSAVAGAGLDSYFVKSVAAQPYNISVLQVSGLIVPPGIDGNLPPPASPPPPVTASPPPPKKADAPAPTPEGSSTPAAAPSKTADSPADAPESNDATADTPADAPATAAPSPNADGPASGPGAAHATAADADAPTKSSAARAVVGAGLAVAMGAAFFGAL